MPSKQTARLFYHQIWVVVGWTMVCLTIYMSLTTSGAVVVGSLLHDKVSHTLGYFCLMLWFMQLYRTNGIRLLFAILLVAMGVALEYLQGLGGVRVFEVADMAANTTGVMLGWLAAALGMDRLLAWFEGRVLKKI
jgi:VanZ family protein